VPKQEEGPLNTIPAFNTKVKKGKIPSKNMENKKTSFTCGWEGSLFEKPCLPSSWERMDGV
jgi:hypothetical protein